MSAFDTPDALDLVLNALPSFTPAEQMAPSTWTMANLWLPASTNARPGPLRLSKYQADMVDAIAAPEVRVAALCMASQVGKSLAIDAFVTWRMATDPGPFLAIYPTDAKAKAWVLDRLNPLISASPVLSALIGGGGKGKAGHSRSRKAFAGGSLNVGSSHKAEDLAQRSIALLLLDEIDRFAPSVGQEGDPVLLAIKRMMTYGSTAKAILASTPTAAGSRIDSWYQRGDRRQWHMPCPECGDLEVLSFSRLKWTPGKPQSAFLLCESCTHHITEAERFVAVEKGAWIATGVPSEPGIISFHASELISTFSKLENVAAQAEEGAKSEEARRVFVNTSLAETYRVEGLTLEVDELAARAEQIRPPYSADILFVAAAVDVQKNRVEVTFLATARAGVQTVLDHVVIPGENNGSVVWEALDRMLGRTFPLTDRRSLAVEITAVDAGNFQEAVVDFVLSQRAKGRRCYATLGRDGFERTWTKRGSKLRDVLSSVIVGIDPIKLNIHQRFAMKDFGPGALRLPDHLPPEYFEQLAFERLETHYVRGAKRTRWVGKESKRSGGGQNEALDCLVYALAISKLVDARKLDPAAPPAEQPGVAMARALNQGGR